MRFTHVLIATADLGALTNFYRQVLGLEPVVFRGEYVEFPTLLPPGSSGGQELQ